MLICDNDYKIGYRQTYDCPPYGGFLTPPLITFSYEMLIVESFIWLLCSSLEATSIFGMGDLTSLYFF
jgi:hypothetical protein